MQAQKPDNRAGAAMKLWAIIYFLFLSTILSGQLLVKGKIENDALWSGLVIVEGDVLIPQGITISISPGTQIRFSAQSDAARSGKNPNLIEFIVFGRLNAIGTEGSGKIVFTSHAPEPKMQDWEGITIKNETVPSFFEYCLIEYANKGIVCYGSSPQIKNCEIRYNKHCGISSEIRSKAFIFNNVITNNEYAGIVCELAATPIVEKNVISQNGNGIIIFDRSKPDLGSIPPKNEGSSGGNMILNNFGHNIYNHSGNNINAQNNLWDASNERDILATLYDKTRNHLKGKIIFKPILEKSNPTQIAKSSNPAPSNHSIPSAKKRSKTPTDKKSKNPAGSVKRIAAGQNNPAQTGSQKTSMPANTRGNIYQADQTKLSGQNAAKRKNNPQTDNPFSNDHPAASNGQINGSPLASNSNPNSNPGSYPTTLNDSLKTESAIEEITKNPIMEALLDSKKREYLNRVSAEYPAIYKKKSLQGKVIIEVVVGYNGSVDSYKILKSNGQYFTESAVKALKQFKYKPGFFQGKPVKFKIIEPFVFRLKKS